jgi:hypothetical protein
MRRQVWFVVTARTVVGLIGFAIVIGYQKYNL